MSATALRRGQEWYVLAGIERKWFGDDELAARTYLLLMRKAFNFERGPFLGRDVPPPHVRKATGSAS